MAALFCLILSLCHTGTSVNVYRWYNILPNMIHYMAIFLWPSHLAVYPLHHFDWALILKSSFFTLILIMFSIIATGFKRNAMITLGWLWFILAFLPAIGLYKSDRFMYFPMIGLSIASTWGFSDLIASVHHRKRVSALFAMIILVVLAVLSWRQVHVWRDSITLFTHAHKTIANNHRAHNNLGAAHVVRGEMEEAMAEYKRALEMRPNYAAAHNNLGLLLGDLGAHQEALEHFKSALEQEPDRADMLNNTGNAYVNLNQWENATRHYQRAIVLKRDYAEAYNNLATALFELGNQQGAIEYFRYALSINPDLRSAHHNLGFLFGKMGRLNKAIFHLKEAIRIQPDHIDSRNKLGVALALQGKNTEAMLHFKKILEMDPNQTDVRYNMELLAGKMRDKGGND